MSGPCSHFASYFTPHSFPGLGFLYLSAYFYPPPPSSLSPFLFSLPLASSSFPLFLRDPSLRHVFYNHTSTRIRAFYPTLHHLCQITSPRICAPVFSHSFERSTGQWRRATSGPKSQTTMARPSTMGHRRLYSVTGRYSISRSRDGTLPQRLWSFKLSVGPSMPGRSSIGP